MPSPGLHDLYSAPLQRGQVNLESDRYQCCRFSRIRYREAMITSDEIDAVGTELGVGHANVERDYVFGWLLAGLYAQDNPLADQLILKGGNAFRKAYFPHARFSKDLDFSIERELDLTQFEEKLRQACEYASAKSGVTFNYGRQNIKEKRSADKEQRSYESRVYFEGFYGEEECTISAKLDIKEFDRIFLPVQPQPLIHAYSDSSDCVATIRCMKLEELLANKLKALLQREHSPDLFDFVYAVLVQNALHIDRIELAKTFIRKTIYERNPFAAYDLLARRPLSVIKDAWAKYLVLPKPTLLAFEEAERLFRDGLEALFVLLGINPQNAAAYAASASIDYFPVERRSVLMEAGRLQRLIEVTYNGYRREMEPYALAYKRRKDGVAREYFYAYDRSGGESGELGIKLMTNDNMSSLRMLDEKFEPRYPIELAKAGEYFGRATFASPSRPPKPRVERPRAIFGRPTTPVAKPYVLVCPYCNKEFRRDSMSNSSLNAHKNSWGSKCSASRGYWR